jgi:hypothetical protein
MNASSSRRSKFTQLQQDLIDKGAFDSVAGVKVGRPQRPLRLIQDVKTRWDSTTYMLIRYRRLRQAVEAMVEREHIRWFRLSEEEWKAVDYLISLAKPFNFATILISTTKGPTVHMVFLLYAMLFNMLEDAKRKLSRKDAAWKVDIRNALNASYDKLRKYYTATTGPLGELYGHAILLSPHVKGAFFKSGIWGHSDSRWGAIYWASLRMLFEKRYCGQNPDNIPDNAQQTKPVRRSLFIDLDAIDDPSELSAKGEFDRYKAASKSFSGRQSGRQPANTDYRSKPPNNQVP